MNVIEAVETAQGDRIDMTNRTVRASKASGPKKASKKAPEPFYLTADGFRAHKKSNKTAFAPKPVAQVPSKDDNGGNPAVSAKKAPNATKTTKAVEQAKGSKASSRKPKEPMPSRADIKEIEAEIKLENANMNWNDATAVAAKPAAQVASEKGEDGDPAPSAKKAPKAPKSAKAAKPAIKTAIILDLVKRPEGVSLKEIMAATSWQAHSVRGFISAVLGKKMGLTVESTKNDAGERTYRIA